MKKLMMILIVLGLLMALPATAGAKKPAEPPGQEPFPGSTCAEHTFEDPSLWQVGVPTDFPVENGDGDFKLTLDSDFPAVCIDVTSFEGVWDFEIVEVEVASFNMQIKDSVPGDMCWRDAWRRTKKTNLPGSLSTPGAIPVAEINACPGDDFTDQAEPLVFMVGYSPDRRAEDSSLTITVTLP